MRRDLHDGLGPALASQGLKLAAARQLLSRDPAAADLLLAQVMSQNENTVADVRRLVYALRPPALDELGLVEAIRDHALGLDCDTSLEESLHIQVEAPAQGLPPLTAAVEVAAYRIALEALTNVTRHAHARRCLIRFSLDTAIQPASLLLEIIDDGAGLPEKVSVGVGLSSMRERAEEVGGSIAIERAEGGGTRVVARLPSELGIAN
jgi:signal transduction histidine kinase